MSALDQSQIDFFNEHGYLVVENAVDADTLSELTSDFAQWVDEKPRSYRSVRRGV